MGLCRAFLATSSLSFLLFGLVVFKAILFCQLCRTFQPLFSPIPWTPILYFRVFFNVRVSSPDRICLVRVLVLHDLHFVLFLSGLFIFTFISPQFISQRILLYTVVILLSCFYICAICTYLLFYTLLCFSVPSLFLTPFVSVFLLHI